MMMTPADAMLELLAGYEQLAEGYAQSLQALRHLTSAGFEGRAIPTAILQDYYEQAEKAAADVERSRALVAKFKQTLTAH